MNLLAACVTYILKSKYLSLEPLYLYLINCIFIYEERSSRPALTGVMRLFALYGCFIAHSFHTEHARYWTHWPLLSDVAQNFKFTLIRLVNEPVLEKSDLNAHASSC